MSDIWSALKDYQIEVDLMFVHLIAYERPSSNVSPCVAKETILSYVGSEDSMALWSGQCKDQRVYSPLSILICSIHSINIISD